MGTPRWLVTRGPVNWPMQYRCWPVTTACWPRHGPVGQVVGERLLKDRGGVVGPAPVLSVFVVGDVMTRSARDRPVDLALAPWPDVPSEDPLGEIGRQFVVRLKLAMGDRSVRSVAREVGVHHATLDKILAGGAWPDLSTIGRLQLALGAQLVSYWVPSQNSRTFRDSVQE